VAGDEEAGLEIILLEKVEQADVADIAGDTPSWMSDGESPPP
jgi:hypothetical protein